MSHQAGAGGREPCVEPCDRGQLVGPLGFRAPILVFFERTPRYMPLDDLETAGVMPQTVGGRHGSCSCASQTSSGSSARTRSCPSVCGSSSPPNQTAPSPPTTTGRPPTPTTT